MEPSVLAAPPPLVTYKYRTKCGKGSQDAGTPCPPPPARRNRHRVRMPGAGLLRAAGPGTGGRPVSRWVWTWCHRASSEVVRLLHPGARRGADARSSHRAPRGGQRSRSPRGAGAASGADGGGGAGRAGAGPGQRGRGPARAGCRWGRTCGVSPRRALRGAAPRTPGERAEQPGRAPPRPAGSTWPPASAAGPGSPSQSRRPGPRGPAPASWQF